MSDSTILPGVRAALIARDGTTSPEFYRFFRSLSVTAELPARVDDLTVRVTALEKGHGNIGNVQGKQSIISQGILSNGLVIVYLDGDVDVAPGLTFYGALLEGSKGWQSFSANFEALASDDDTYSLDLADLANSGNGTLHAVTVDAKGRVSGYRDATITGTAGNITVAHGDASDGLPTIDLADLADSGTGAALVRITRDSKGRVSGMHAATTTDLAEGANLYFTNARADARITLQKGQPNGLATLDAGGKLDTGQLPALAITETFVVADEASMLALTAEQGDVAVRTDLSKSFILTTNDPTVLANWQDLLTPTSPVTSVFGRVGSVTAASGDYTFAQIADTPTTLDGYGITDAATAAQGALADTALQPGAIIPAADVSGLATVATTGSYDDLDDKPTIPAAQVNADWDATSGIEEILHKPTLGTAAAADADDFATAAQGSKADSAVQTVNGMTGPDVTLPSSGVPYLVATGQTYAVPLGIQALWTIPIELEGAAELDVSGHLVEVA